MKHKCYIAGQISGLEREEYINNFEKAKKEVIELGYEPISPLDLEHGNFESWDDYMKVDLKALIDCDYIYMLNNWKNSRGAKIELRLAMDLKIETIMQK